MLPVLGALILQAAYGAVDLLVVGRFGSTAGLSAVSTGSQILNLVTFVVTQLAMGVTVLIARYLGEKRPEQIGAVLALAGRAAWAPEFISSLPFAGEDGTMRNRPLEKGSAHVKTGYIRGVRSVAGYVLALSGRWYTVCAIVNDPAALGAKPALDALLEAVAEKG